MGAVDVVEPEGGPLVDPLVVVEALGWPDDALETRLSAAVMDGCRESFRLEAASRVGVPDAADEESLPKKKKGMKIIRTAY